MPRLFIAIDLPEPVKEQLTALRTDMPGASWSKPHTMHLTLRFLSDAVPAAQVEPIRNALRGVSFAPFDLQLVGVGRFPPSPRQTPRVLWAGIAEQPALDALYRQIERAIGTVGFARETRPFSGHITLARLRHGPPVEALDRFFEAHREFASPVFPVRAFVLYQSELLPQGPRYTVVEWVPASP